MFWRRKQEEDPFAALSGDGTPALPGIPGPGPAAPRAPEGRISGRIMSRRETGVLVSGVPRVELRIELRPEGRSPVVVEHRTVAPAGSASAVGDEVTVELDRRGTVIDVDFRPAIRRPRGG